MSVLERVRAAEREGSDAVASGAGALLGQAREHLKADLVERLGLATIAGMLANEDPAKARSELAVALEAICNGEAYGRLGPDLRAEAVRQVTDEVCGLGPIQPMLDDPAVSEVMINGPRSLFYESAGELFPARTTFDSDEQIMIAVDRILAPLGRRLDQASPLVSARLPNGDRVNAVAAGISLDGTAVTIRRFSNEVRTLDRLVALGSLPEWFARLLAWAVRCRRSMAVAGGTGSGKTTLLNALSREIDPAERVITIEDAAELRFETHPNVVRLEAREASIEGTGEVTIRTLVKNALRMRPDRIVVGEVRGEECIDMLQAMSTGHDGSMTTLHAGSPQEAIVRLVLMARFGMDLPTRLIEEQIALAIDLIVMQKRMADGTRLITTLSEVSRSEGGGVELAECVSFDEAGRAWELVREPGFVGTAVAEGRLGEEEVEEWRESCS